MDFQEVKAKSLEEVASFVLDVGKNGVDNWHRSKIAPYDNILVSEAHIEDIHRYGLEHPPRVRDILEGIDDIDSERIETYPQPLATPVIFSHLG